MKRELTRLFLVLVFPLAVACCSDAILVFQVEDAVSGKWVWDATVRLQDRTLVSYYQSDAGPVPQRISHLTPGQSIAQFSAPGYESVSIPVTLHRGRNRLPEPVRMTGVEIPGLAGFRMLESIAGGDVLFQVMAADFTGTAIRNHPCIDLWIGCVVSEQVNGTARARGEILYRGSPGWRWNGLPESKFRYSARIPSSSITGPPSLPRVMDYLVVVPRPDRISRAEVDAIMESAWQTGGLAAGPDASRLSSSIAPSLDARKGKLKWFFSTSWGVQPGPGGRT